MEYIGKGGGCSFFFYKEYAVFFQCVHQYVFNSMYFFTTTRNPTDLRHSAWHMLPQLMCSDVCGVVKYLKVRKG
jgi:hypothetical protein